MADHKLTEQKKKFCAEYVKNGCKDGKAAAVAAKYAEGSAKESASRLLAQKCVKDEIARLMAPVVQEREGAAEAVTAELMRLGHSNILNYITICETTGQLLVDLKDIPHELGSAIKDLTIQQVTIEGADGKPEVKQTISIKLHEKTGPLNSLARSLGMFEKHEKVPPPPPDPPGTQIGNVNIENLTVGVDDQLGEIFGEAIKRVDTKRPRRIN
ncbi:terminase small subunit [Parvibaculaceae bacterium PLY_AMNH_Bact1]|nr:terminase small subunit [Parvibaculaceae bacterium PLY_AMNH_Bact1]